MKKTYFLLVLFLISYSNVHDNYFKKVEGNWQITKFYHIEQDTVKDVNYLLMGFERNTHLWFSKVDHTNEFTSSKCNIYKSVDT